MVRHCLMNRVIRSTSSAILSQSCGRLIETSENSARLIGSSRQPASIPARVRLSSKRQARGQHAFEPGAKVSVAERADWILASLAG